MGQVNIEVEVVQDLVSGFWPYAHDYPANPPNDPLGWIGVENEIDLQFTQPGTFITITGTQDGFGPGVWTGTVDWSDGIWIAFTPDSTEYNGDGSAAWDEYAVASGDCEVSLWKITELTVTWPTKRIFLPRSVLTHVSGTLYELDTNWLRQQLKDAEDSEDGIPFLDTHRHNTEVTVAGTTFAQTIEIINGYSLEFENGAYSVRLIGSNNNLFDVDGGVLVQNRVQVISTNSAGLIQTPELRFGSFEGAVWVDEINGVDSTLYPAGTPRLPVNNLAVAREIADQYGFSTLQVLGNMTIESGKDVSNLLLVGQNAMRTLITVDPGALVDGTEFRECSLTGTLGDGNIIRYSYVYDLDYVNGFIYETQLSGSIVLDGTFPTSIMSSYSGENGVTIDMGGSGKSLTASGFHGDMTIANKTGTDSCILHCDTASITIDSSVTNGTGLHIGGIGDLHNESLITPQYVGLLSSELVSDTVWDELLADHQITGSTGDALDNVGGEGASPEAIAEAVWDEPTADHTTSGTYGFLVKKLLTVAKFLGLK